MEITIRANCWDGVRQKSLAPAPVIAFVAPVLPPDSRWHTIRRKLNHPGVRSLIGVAVPVALMMSGIPHIGLTSAFAHAAVAAVAPEAVPVLADSTKQAILHAFDPLVNMIISLSYPIAGVMIAGGCLFVMIGQRERGMGMLQNAAIGYILVQLSPLLLRLLVGIGESV